MAKCKVVHIGVFFDGTGNNKANDKGNGSQSNIAKLSDLYIHGKKISNYSNEQCDHYGHMIYKDGVGTTAGKRDYLKDKTDKGAGGGGAKRINEVINVLHIKLQKGGEFGVDKGYRERIIDVFGFSRGAAMARDFINTFYDKNDRHFKLTKVRINFVGLYDTVGSFGEAGNDINFKPIDTDPTFLEKTSKIIPAPGLIIGNYIEQNFLNSEVKSINSDFDTTTRTAYDYQSAEIMEREMIKGGWSLKNTQMGPGGVPYTMTFQKIRAGFEPYNFVLAHNSAVKIVHMIASDEVRKNFPLSSIGNIASSNPLSGHQEWTYGGVHSDIGGGYEPKMIEKHSIQFPMVSSYAKALEMEQKKKPSLTSGWVFTKTPVSTNRVGDRSYSVKASFNRTITNDISSITLYRMHEEAIRNHVPFQAITIPMPATMHDYDVHTKANPSSAMSFKGIEELRLKYFHHSAVDQNESDTHYDGNTSIKSALLDDSPDGIGGNDTRYVNHKPKRDIYPNKGKAIPPTKF